MDVAGLQRMAADDETMLMHVPADLFGLLVLAARDLSRLKTLAHPDAPRGLTAELLYEEAKEWAGEFYRPTGGQGDA